MKTCRKGLHQYPDDKKRCPECKKLYAGTYQEFYKAKKHTAEYKAKQNEYARVVYKMSPEEKEVYKASRKPKVKTCRKGLHQYYPTTDHSGCPECRKVRQVAIKNSDQYKEYQRTWQKTPQARATRNAYMNNTYKHTEKYKAMKKAYANSPKAKAARKLLNSKHSCEFSDLTNEQLEDRFIEFDGLCAYCNVVLTMYKGPKQYHNEHIIARNCGGKNTISNIVPACRTCNVSKQDKDVRVWMKEKNYIPSEKLTAILNVLFPPTSTTETI